MVVGVPLDDAEARQAGGESNFTIDGDELEKLVDEIKQQLELEEDLNTVPSPAPPYTVGDVLYRYVTC